MTGTLIAVTRWPDGESIGRWEKRNVRRKWWDEEVRSICAKIGGAWFLVLRPEFVMAKTRVLFLPLPLRHNRFLFGLSYPAGRPN